MSGHLLRWGGAVLAVGVLLAFVLLRDPAPATAATTVQAPAAPAGAEPRPSPAAAPAATSEPPTRAVDARSFDWEAQVGKSQLVAFFSQHMRDLPACLRCYQQLHEERSGANLAVVAVCIDGDRPLDLDAVLQANRLTLPVVVDTGGALRAQFRPRSMPHAFFFAEGRRYLGDLPGFPDAGSPTPAALYTNLLRRAVGLEFALDNDPLALPLPAMPAFAIAADGDQPAVRAADLAGAPYVLTFVAAGCERCKEQLELFASLQQEFGDRAPEFVVVLVDDDVDPAALQRQRSLPFPIRCDRGGELRRTLRYRGLVPDTFVVDGDGRIRYRHTAWDDEQPPLYRMELRRLLGLPNPPILKQNAPSGVRRCMICHERQYFDWRSSGHAHAMRTLQAIGRAEDPECVRCHVVGFGQAGGYDHDGGARAAWLGDVQCEVCHEAGGPHAVGVDGVPRGHRPVSSATCTGCHDHEHSLGFDYDRFVALVRHDSDLLRADPAAQHALAAARDRARRDLLEPDGSYVGAAACRPCHEAQYARWQATPHARALSRLDGAERDRDDCRRCHLTGVGRSWEAGAPAIADDAAVAGVQCESCHGPGQRHVASGGDRSAVVGLGARCEECVLRQVCTTCHDRANDPDFDLGRDLVPMRAQCAPAGGAGTAPRSAGR